MAKVELSDRDIRCGQDICSGCIHYAGKDGWPAERICNFSAKYNGTYVRKISKYECTAFEPGEYAARHWNITDIKYIGITENRLHHILGVARKAYQIAKQMGKDERFCRRCFMLGWLHDVGYEFSIMPEQHPEKSAEMLLSLTDNPAISDSEKKAYTAIRCHGSYTAHMTDEYKILTAADMTVDADGKEVDVMTRLEGIKQRYGERSNQYLTACDICYRTGLTADNVAANIT